MMEKLAYKIFNIISFSYILTSSIENERGSYSPNPFTNEQRFELPESSSLSLTPRFSTSLLLTDVSQGSCRHPKICDNISLVGFSPAPIVSRYTVKASEVLRVKNSIKNFHVEYNLEEKPEKINGNPTRKRGDLQTSLTNFYFFLL